MLIKWLNNFLKLYLFKLKSKIFVWVIHVHFCFILKSSKIIFDTKICKFTIPDKFKYFWFLPLSLLHALLHRCDDAISFIFSPMFWTLLGRPWNKNGCCFKRKQNVKPCNISYWFRRRLSRRRAPSFSLTRGNGWNASWIIWIARHPFIDFVPFLFPSEE